MTVALREDIDAVVSFNGNITDELCEGTGMVVLANGTSLVAVVVELTGINAAEGCAVCDSIVVDSIYNDGDNVGSSDGTIELCGSSIALEGENVTESVLDFIVSSPDEGTGLNDGFNVG